MSYDRTLSSSGALSYDFGGDEIDTSGGDVAIGNTVKAIVVVATGDVVCRAVDGSADITVTGAPVGFILPWHCSHIRQTGTTATLATVVGR